MKNLPVRWHKGGWPVLSVRPDLLLAATARRIEQAAAAQEWEDEGGALKQAIVAGPKLPL
jgi:hypothetical protein